MLSIGMKIMKKTMKNQFLKWKVSNSAMTLTLLAKDFREVICDCVIRKPGEREGMKLRALWDTGCTNTHIAQRVADALKLEQCGLGRSISVDHYSVDKAYRADIVFPVNKGLMNHVVYSSPLPEIDVLIGLDVIRMCDFSISNDGKGNCTCSIRFPSQGVTDYTE